MVFSICIDVKPCLNNSENTEIHRRKFNFIKNGRLKRFRAFGSGPYNPEMQENND